MKNWKKLLLPGLGGVVVGLLAVAAGRRFRTPHYTFSPVPEELENFALLDGGSRFDCRKTGFKVWSLLGGTAEQNSASQPSRIYHVSRRTGTGGAESFYATIHGIAPGGRPRSGQLALGCPVEFRECRVGGAVNGVETGRRVRTEGSLERIEPIPRSESAQQ